jgi:hypothetical protein
MTELNKAVVIVGPPQHGNRFALLRAQLRRRVLAARY